MERLEFDGGPMDGHRLRWFEDQPPFNFTFSKIVSLDPLISITYEYTAHAHEFGDVCNYTHYKHCGSTVGKPVLLDEDE